MEMNSENRRLDRRRVERFKRAIDHGLWINTGEPVIVSREGILNEGQHRLAAITAGTKTVELDIRFGVSRSAFQATGTGATRSAADSLQIMGKRYVTGIASSTRLVMMYSLGLPESFHMIITAQEVVKAASERWPDMEDAISLAYAKLNISGPTKLMNAAGGAWTFMALKQSNRAKVEQFLDIVGLGTTTDRYDPPLLLRNRLMASEHGRTQPVEKLALFIKAWNAWTGGDRITNLRWRGHGDRAEAFPVMAKVRL
jgi:hypothetical protein